jgi:hypothetical protein
LARNLFTSGNEVCEPDLILGPKDVAVDDRVLNLLKRKFQRRQFTQPDRVMRAVLRNREIEQIPEPFPVRAAPVQAVQLTQVVS